MWFSVLFVLFVHKEHVRLTIFEARISIQSSLRWVGHILWPPMQAKEPYTKQ